MQILSLGPPPATSAVDVYRQDSVLGSFALAVGLAAVSAAFFLAVGRVAELPLVMRLFALPMLALGALICLSLTGVLFQVARASLKPTNWSVALSADAVYVNLRASRNADLEGGQTRALVFEHSEIAAIGQVREVYRERTQKGYRSTGAEFLELRLHAWEPGELEALVDGERQLDLGAKRKARAVTVGQHHHVPAFVAVPGRIRLRYDKALLVALSGLFDVDAPRRDDLNQILEPMNSEERVRALVLRGQRFRAVRMAREELGFSRIEAEEWVDAPLADTEPPARDELRQAA